MDVSTQNKYDALPWYIRLLLDLKSLRSEYDMETNGLNGKFIGVCQIKYKTLFGVKYVLEVKTIEPLNQIMPKRARVKW